MASCAGHPHCTQWLIQSGANLDRQVLYSVSIQNISLAETMKKKLGTVIRTAWGYFALFNCKVVKSLPFGSNIHATVK